MTEQTQAQATLPADFNANVDVADFKFRFKKDKMDNQRPNVELKGFVPSVEGIIQIVNGGGKGLELLRDAMYDVIRGVIGADVGDDEKYSQETYEANVSKYTWDAIANAPREDRRANAIPAELWEAFAKDYIEIMPALTGKSTEAVTNATLVYVKKFAQVKTDKKVLAKLQEQLGIYTNHTKKGEEFVEILDLLARKVETFLKSDDIEMLKANL